MKVYLSTEGSEVAFRLFTRGFEKVRIAEILDCTPKTIHRIIGNFNKKLRKTITQKLTIITTS